MCRGGSISYRKVAGLCLFESLVSLLLFCSVTSAISLVFANTLRLRALLSLRREAKLFADQRGFEILETWLLDNSKQSCPKTVKLELSETILEKLQVEFCCQELWAFAGILELRCDYAIMSANGERFDLSRNYLLSS